MRKVAALPPVLAKTLAGIAFVLGGAFMAPFLVVLVAALAQRSPIGLGYALIWLALGIPAVPLLVLAVIVWRRASRRST